MKPPRSRYRRALLHPAESDTLQPEGPITVKLAKGFSGGDNPVVVSAGRGEALTAIRIKNTSGEL